jgi:hypothetical protein
MNKIVSDLGFRSLDNIIIYENWSNFSASATSIDLPPDADLSLFKGNLNKEDLALMMLKFLKILLIGNRKLSGFFVVIGKNTITKTVLGLINIKVK